MMPSTVKIFITATIAGIAINKATLSLSLEQLKEDAHSNPTYKKLLDKIIHHTFARSAAEEDSDIRQYFNVRYRLSICNDIILYTFEDRAPRSYLTAYRILSDIIFTQHTKVYINHHASCP